MPQAISPIVTAPAEDPGGARHRHATTEATIVLLQATVALLFVAGAYLGVFHVASPAREIIAAWVAMYHVLVTAYSFRHRVRGKVIPWVEPMIPVLDISCITAVYIALNDPVSPVWAVYLYALIGYSRRYAGFRYALVSAYTVTNLVAGWLAIGNPAAGEFLVMVVLSVAVISLSSTISESWRDAERRARMLSQVDPLTGLWSRGTVFERLEGAEDVPQSILMLDLDHFKRLNDDFGHLHGDQVLRSTAKAIVSSIPPTAIAGRFGGEEFIVALPGLDVRQATHFGEAIREAVAAATPTTISIGCTARRPMETIDQTIRRADELLYVAKRQGRDRVAMDPSSRVAA